MVSRKCGTIHYKLMLKRGTSGKWPSRVVEAFPSHEYFIDNLKKMMDRKKLREETMMQYYYSKYILVFLVRKCDIKDNNAVSCIIPVLHAL